MKRLVIVAVVLAILAPGAAIAGSSTDAALGLGAFAVLNQIISGTGVFGALHPAHAPVVVPAPPPVVVPPPVHQPVVVHKYYPVYTHPSVHYAPPPVYYAPPRRVVVIKERGWAPPYHGRHGHHGHFKHKNHRWHD